MAADQDFSPSETTDSNSRSIASFFGPLGAARGDDGRFTRLQVWLKVGLIVFYIAIATVWFPSWLMKPNSLAVVRDLYAGLMPGDLWDTVLSLIVSGVWFMALAFGLWAMRQAQKRRLI